MSVLGRDVDARPVRLAYLVTHPIQYQAPLLRLIAADPAFRLTVFFCSDFSTRAFKDQGFGRDVQWDVPLLEGYDHEVLPRLGSDSVSTLRPLNYGLTPRLRRGDFDVLWVHGYARPYHFAVMAAAQAMGIKVLLRDEASQISKRRGALRAGVKRAYFAGLRRICDGFLAIGSLNREYYLANGIFGDQIFPMPYAVDNERFQRQATAAAQQREAFRAELRLEPGRPVILYAAKMMPRKRPLDLLKAYTQLGDTSPRPYLLFVGDGEQRAEAERHATIDGSESVRFLGFRGQRQLPAFYDLADLFVLPSVWEPWGLAVNEAMNAGTAILVSDRVGSATDLVRQGENGAIFRAGDMAALAASLAELLAEPQRLQAMGHRSREIIDGWSFAEDIVGLKQAVAAVCK